MLQATSLPFIVAATSIGVALGKLSAVTAAAVVSAGRLSVLIFPAIPLGLLRERAGGDAEPLPSPRTERTTAVTR